MSVSMDELRETAIWNCVKREKIGQKTQLITQLDAIDFISICFLCLYVYTFMPTFIAYNRNKS